MIFVLLYTCLSGFIAWFNYILIKQGKNIKHWLNGASHISAAVLIGYFTNWNYGLAVLCFVRVVFDTVLNIFRHKGVGYISPAPASMIDKAEQWMILELAEIICRKKRIISDTDIERVAIGFRIIILLTGIIFLFL